MNRRRGLAGLAAVLVLGGLVGCSGQASDKSVQMVKPFYGPIKISVATTGTVQPYNRLALKPPIAGRVDQVLVAEGDTVHRGQILAWLSSTERAALLDAARAQGEKAYTDWAEVYKPAPVVSPINGTVIVRTVLPGQTVAASDDILVLSDRLIVMAQVDETDIGKVRLGQSVVLSLDAYPDIRVPARVDHIEYESKTVNNVTIYQVDIVPNHVPPEFRSGMSADAEITLTSKDNALLVPKEAIQQGKKNSYVLVSQNPKDKPEARPVQLGLVNDSHAEIISGITVADTVVIAAPDLTLFKGANTKTNPFMPSRPRGGTGSRSH